MRLTIRVQEEDFDAGLEAALLSAGRTDIGALVSFTGLCRDEAGTLAAMTLETYADMARMELSAIATQAASRWQISAATIIHRHGRLTPGSNIVLVITASSHRKDAFEAAEFLMDYLKTRAPLWKSEERLDGAQSWVAAKDSDDEAANRWR